MYFQLELLCFSQFKVVAYVAIHLGLNILPPQFWWQTDSTSGLDSFVGCLTIRLNSLYYGHTCFKAFFHCKLKHFPLEEDS